jgi:hypothetical protein
MTRVRCAGLPVVIRTREMPDEYDVEGPCGWEGLLPEACRVDQASCPDCGGLIEPTPARPAEEPARVALDQADIDALLIVGFYAREQARPGSPLAIAANRVIALGHRAEGHPATGQMKEEPCGA